MKNLKKLLLITVSALAVTAHASEVTSLNQPVTSAPDLQVKLNAFAHFQTGIRNQSHLSGAEKNLSANKQGFAFFSEAAMSADVSNEFNGVKYGGNVILVPTAKRKNGSFNGSHIYMDSNFGKIEAGSPNSASSKMSLEAGEIASATGGDWDRYANFNTERLNGGSEIEPSFATFAEFFLDSKLVTKLDSRSYSSEPTRAISYYTPKFEFGDKTKTQLGVSYSPDSANTGADNHDTNGRPADKRTVTLGGADGKTPIDFFEINRNVKDAITAGFTVEQNLADGVDLKVALTGEHAKAAGSAKRINVVNGVNTTIATHKLKDLRTYNIGAVLSFGNFSYAGSYGSLGKSLTTDAFHKTGQKTTYYTGAMAYKQGPFTASVSYFKSNQFGNIVDAVSIGTDCKLAPGIKPYAEITAFTLKGRPEFYEGTTPGKKNTSRGTVALIGAKLSL